LIYLYLLNIFRKALIQPIGTATRILRLFSGRVSPPKIGALVESAQSIYGVAADMVSWQTLGVVF